MRKRSFVAVAFAALLAVGLFGLAGCTGSGTYQPELKPAEVAPPVIGEEGTLRVGVNTENPPLAGMGSGKIIGIDVDIAAALADELGLATTYLRDESGTYHEARVMAAGFPAGLASLVLQSSAFDSTRQVGVAPGILEATGLRTLAYEEALSYTPTINETYCRTILHALSQTEPVDEAWTKRLSSLSGSFTSTLKKASSYLAKAPLPELTAVYQYIFYRALEKEPFCGIDAVMTYARQSTDFIFMETAVFEDLPENIRRWSEQIEYDTDNPDILLSLITK